MEENNALLREQLIQLVSVRAALQVIMVYLPSCASGREPSRDAVTRLGQALQASENDLHLESVKRQKRAS